MANNYLNHKDKVDFYENYLNRSKEWKKYIDLIEYNFELKNIVSFDGFLIQRPIVGDVFSYFIKIIECDPEDVSFNNYLFQELFWIVEFYLGKKEKLEIKELITSNFAKVLFLIVWITKLENQDNKTDYLFDLGLLTQKNMSLLLKIDTLFLFEEEILQFFDSIEIKGLNVAKKIFSDNINDIIYPVDTEFLESVRNKIVQVNAFDFNRIERRTNISWEENYILDMLNISFEDRKIIPMFSSGDSTTPDFKQWTKEKLDEMQKYFNHDITDFVIESIRYILFGIIPSKKIIEKHIELFIENFNNVSTLREKYDNSSFCIISYLFEEGQLNAENAKDLFVMLSTIKDLEEIMILNSHNIPLNKKQKRILKEYYQSCFLRLDDIADVYSYAQYLENEDNVKSINNEYFYKNIEMFNKYISSTDNNIFCANLFIDYMLFLTRVNRNSNIDKEYVKYEMIRIQELWENQYYNICVSQLHSFRQEFEVKKDEIESFNRDAIDNIFSIANTCVITQTQQYVENMELVSSNPISFMFRRVSFDKIFPMDEKLAFDIGNHDVDKLTTKIIESIKKEYGYRFLNILDTDIYVKAFHKRMIQNAKLSFSFFNKTKELYYIVQSKLKDHFILIDYSENIQLAHLMQLFPIIEILIKKIGKAYNIFPFKEDEKHFMQSKDPSSVLRLILEKAYEETKGFEVVPDLLFIYHYLYNGNSLNIRNECVHGRNYLSEESLLFAFKITLASLYMLIKRLEIISSYKESRDKDMDM